jgi:uncharacterized RDD family membrane protein YckC
MTARALAASPLRVHADLLGLRLASPFRRLCAFLLDGVILFLPSVAVAVGAAALSLWFADPAALHAVTTLFRQGPHDAAQVARSLEALAPVLVRTQAEGLPPSVALAVHESDLPRAGELLSEYSIDITMTPGTDASPLAPGHIRFEAERLLPRGLRSAALFGTAALYFTFFASGRRTATIGKWIFGMRVRRLDGRPLTWWESFERFGGYLASLGTLGLGLLDFWRDPNRRLAHDRISSTVVLRSSRGRQSQDA